MRVADIVAQTLARAGVGRLFVAPAVAEASLLLDAAGRCQLPAIRTERARTACLMAAVTGALGDAPGGAAVSSAHADEGMGEALEQAMRDRAPLVIVGDGAPSDAVERRVKATVVVEAATAAHWSAHAVQLALKEPRGPVHLVVAPGVAGEAAIPVATSVRPAPLPAPEAPALDQAASMLADAARPVLVAGVGCRLGGVAAWLRALAESLPAPVLVTTLAKGALPDPHPLQLGLLGGARWDHPVLARADLLVTVGLDPAEVPVDAAGPSAPILHLGALSWASTLWRPGREVVGDIALVLEELAPRLRGRQRADWDVAEIDRLKRSLGPRPVRRPLAREAVAGLVREATPPGTVAVISTGADDGDLIAAWPVVAPGELVSPLSPGIAGFALPAALAAQLACPQSRIVCFTSGVEVQGAGWALAAAVRLALPVLVLMVKEADGVPLSSRPPLAARESTPGWTVTAVGSETDMRRAIELGMASGRPVLVDARGVDG